MQMFNRDRGTGCRPSAIWSYVIDCRQEIHGQFKWDIKPVPLSRSQVSKVLKLSFLPSGCKHLSPNYKYTTLVHFHVLHQREAEAKDNRFWDFARNPDSRSTLSRHFRQ